MTKDMQQSELSQMLRVVRMYYERGLTQQQIAKEEFISKSTVCRLLKRAVQNGYVKVQINYPLQSVQALEDEFLRRFALDKVFVTPTLAQDEESRLRDTCKSVAADLLKIIRPEDILTVSWGNTLDRLAGVILREGAAGKKCDKVVLMNGSTAGDIASTRSSRIVGQLAEYFSAEGYLMPVPLVVDDARTAQVIRRDSHVSYVMDYVALSRLCVVSIGALSQHSVLRKRGAFTKQEFDEVLAMGAVGDVAGRCFDLEGNAASGDIGERLMTPTLDEIKSKEIRIGIAVGNRKAKAIVGALRGGIVNRLYTDEMTAKETIKLLKKM